MILLDMELQWKSGANGAVVYWLSLLHNFIQQVWTEVLRKFKSCSLHVGDSRWWGSLTWSQLEIRLNVFRRSTIPQKQFITIIIIITIIKKKKSHSDRFRHIQVLSSISRNYSGVFKTLCNFGIIRAVVYLELWQIQNQKHIQNPRILRTLAYSFQIQRLIQTSTMSIIYDEAFCKNI